VANHFKNAVNFQVGSRICTDHFSNLQSFLHKSVAASTQGQTRQPLEAIMSGYRTTQIIYVATSLGIADLLADSPKTAVHLAELTHTQPEFLYRLLRALAGLGIFQEIDEKFHLTPDGSRLRVDQEGSLAPFLNTYGESWWWNAFGNLKESVITGKTAFEITHGVPFFEYLGKNPKAAKIFNANMTTMTKPSAKAIVAAYDFSPFKSVVDIGGGHGALLNEIQTDYPSIQTILFDQGSVVEGAILPESVSLPRKFISGNFFESIPVTADLYMLKDIIHDWNDQQSEVILGNCVKAMKETKNAKLLVVDRIIPLGNEFSEFKMMDISMMVLTGGKERTLKEAQALFERSGLRLLRTFDTEVGTICELEVNQ